MGKIEPLSRAVLGEKIGCEDGVVFVDFQRIAVDEIERGIRGESRFHPREGAGQIGVVGVQPRHDLAARETEPLVDGIGLAFVRAPVPGEAIAIALENLRGVVGRNRVHHQHLHVGHPLIEDAAQGGLDPPAVVVGRDHDAETGCGHGVTCS